MPRVLTDNYPQLEGKADPMLVRAVRQAFDHIYKLDQAQAASAAAPSTPAASTESTRWDATRVLAFTVTITTPGTAATYTYPQAFTAAPVFVVTPTTIITGAGGVGVGQFCGTTTTAVLTVNVSVAQLVNRVFNVIVMPRNG